MFKITPDDIAKLDDETLRTLVAYLCEAECQQRALSPVSVTWGGNQDAPDGGIDVRVDLSPKTQIGGFIPRPKTGFQIKAKDMPKSAILSEMTPKGKLLKSILDLAGKNGAYILVSSRGSVSDQALTNRRNAMVIAAESVPEEHSLELDFYDRTRMATWVNQHPGVIPWVREQVGRSLVGWRSYDDWSSSPTTTEAPYLVDDSLRVHHHKISPADGVSAVVGIDAIRDVLKEERGSVRLVGLSGVGKTRLVQALFDERMGNNALDKYLAVYADIGDEPAPIPLDLLSRLIGDHHRAILIVDNCGPELHRKLTQAVNRDNSKVSLITIEYDITDDEIEGTDIFRLEPSSNALIEQILDRRFPHLGASNIRVIGKFAGGNARIALALADTVSKGESLGELKSSDLFRRLFLQKKDTDRTLFLTGQACSLLYSFDGETLDEEKAELSVLASVASLSVETLYASIAALHRRKLVQKRGKWRAILPQAIANRLAKRALEDFPCGRIQQHIVDGAPPRLRKSFAKRIGYLHESEEAQRIASAWLNDPRTFRYRIGRLDTFQLAVLTNIAPAIPERTLEAIEESAAKNDGLFATDNPNKTEVTLLLRSLAYDPVLFERAVKQLLRFARNEPLDDHNAEAVNVVVSLFCAFLSGTLATREQRTKVVRDLLESDNRTDNEIGLKLLSAMLQTAHFSSHYHFDFGAWPRTFGWRPKDESEVRDWFESAALLACAAAKSHKPIAASARSLLAREFRGLVTRAGILDRLVTITQELLAGGYWADGWLAVRSVLRLDGKRLPEHTIARLKELEKRLAPSDLEATIRTHALSAQWGHADVAETEHDAKRDYVAAHKRIGEKCTELGRDLAQAPELIGSLLPEILRARSNRTWNLGRGVADGCQSLEVTWSQLKAAALEVDSSERQLHFVTGFISGARERDEEESNRILDDVLGDDTLKASYPVLQAAVPLSRTDLKRLSGSFAYDEIPSWAYGSLSYGRILDGVSVEDLRQLLAGIITKRDGPAIAAEIFGMYLYSLESEKKPISRDQRRIGRMILQHVEFEKSRGMRDHRLGHIVRTAFEDPESAVDARALSEKLLLAIQEYRIAAWDYDDVIVELARLFPEMVLDVFVEKAQAKQPLRSTFSDIREFGQCPLDCIPINTQIQWARREPETRFLSLARAVRVVVVDKKTEEPSWSAIALELISQSGDSIPVLEVLYRRLDPMSWSGSKAAILEKRLVLLQQIGDVGCDPRFKSWADEKSVAFNKKIAEERASEDKWHRARHERFED